MYFGLTNALAAFMELMNGVCRSHLDSFVIVFIKDILVYSKLEEDHDRHLRIVLQIFREEKFYDMFSKCEFWLDSMAFLGHMMTKESIWVDPAKIETVKGWTKSISLTEIWSSSDTITSREVLDNWTETIAPTTIPVVDTQVQLEPSGQVLTTSSSEYDSEDNHSDNNDGQDVEVLSGDDQSIDNSTNLTPPNTSVDGTNEAQVPNVQLEVDFPNCLTLSILIIWKLLSMKIKEEVFMNQPSDFVDEQYPKHVCLLKKELYGLKQAPRAWFDRFSLHLLHLCFKCSKTDSLLLILQCDREMILLLLYIDEIIITDSSSELIANIITGLGKEFTMKDLGPLHFFLRVDVRYFKDGIHLNQGKYVIELLMKTDMALAKAVSTPLERKHGLQQVTGNSINVSTYSSIVGSLQYLTITRPDVSHTINLVSQFMQTPNTEHLQAVKRILIYVKGTSLYGLRLLT
ncbi:hypothetical protein MTR67_002870 [Solanum verrucosum]|uniref:Reverse transcriptase Ty1/copia-type domain-containing protein n=1 Tax=Solanum verrucosum TaxID=315347 RepID=A0AAF0PT99_SOLVR|nr:hypothetical protein MTR67_002870 [Solanum verrucosum]